MPNPILGTLEASVTNIVGVADSAIVLLNGITERIQKAVDQALADGASAQELADRVGAVISAVDAEASALAAAVAANTPPARKA